LPKLQEHNTEKIFSAMVPPPHEAHANEKFMHVLSCPSSQNTRKRHVMRVGDTYMREKYPMYIRKPQYNLNKVYKSTTIDIIAAIWHIQFSHKR